MTTCRGLIGEVTDYGSFAMLASTRPRCGAIRFPATYPRLLHGVHFRQPTPMGVKAMTFASAWQVGQSQTVVVPMQPRRAIRRMLTTQAIDPQVSVIDVIFGTILGATRATAVLTETM